MSAFQHVMVFVRMIAVPVFALAETVRVPAGQKTIQAARPDVHRVAGIRGARVLLERKEAGD